MSSTPLTGDYYGIPKAPENPKKRMLGGGTYMPLLEPEPLEPVTWGDSGTIWSPDNEVGGR